MSKLKAYKVGLRNGNFYSAVVFAETAGKARAAALNTETCEDADYTEIEARRCPALDSEYRGHTEMEWYDNDDRLALVKKCGFRCEYPELDECEECVAKDYCGGYEEALEAAKEDEEGMKEQEKNDG